MNNEHSKDSTEITTQDDALLNVFLRNMNYQARMYFVFFLWLFTLVGICILSGIVTYLVKHPTQPIYFPADQAGRLIKEISVHDANLSDDAVASWAIQAVQSAYSYDFVNYHAQLQKAQRYFFESGWREYMRGLEQSNNLLGLTERKMIIIAKVVDKPVLKKRGYLPNGTLAWSFAVHVLITTYTPPYGVSTKSENPWIVNLVIARQSILENSDGLGILQMNAGPATG
ncbi:MAG: DotI/IcmL/TraM family protein [Gammaproteobacteria bacterium]|nr:DotI/IcmL/TraM family protein [Gammaproteobacteria bacterium]